MAASILGARSSPRRIRAHDDRKQGEPRLLIVEEPKAGYRAEPDYPGIALRQGEALDRSAGSQALHGVSYG